MWYNTSRNRKWFLHFCIFRIYDKGEKQYGLYIKGKKLKFLNENDFKEDIQNLDIEIEKINNIFNTNEFFVKNKELMNITLDQT